MQKRLRTVFMVTIPVIVVVFVIYIFTVSAREVVHSEEVSVPEVKPTAMDTLILNYDKILSNTIDSLQSIGAAVALTYKGEIVFLKCYGVREKGGSDSINSHTIFRLASVSKTITGVLAGILSEEKTLRLDDKVIDYLPGFALKDSINTYDLSIRNILSHTSGLVPHAYDNLVEAQVPFKVIMDSLHRVNISAVPGKLYGYQNVVFSLYDTIATVKTGKSFNDLLGEKVFNPLGMTDASAGFKPFMENSNKAMPHNRSRALAINDRYYNTNPAAGINASISDLAHLLLALNGENRKILDSKVAKEVLTPQIITPLKWNYLRKWDEVESKHYALGWRIIGYNGRQIAYHGGYVQGYRAEIALCREEEIGIAFLTNSPNGVGSMSIPTFLDMYFEMKQKTDSLKVPVLAEPLVSQSF